MGSWFFFTSMFVCALKRRARAKEHRLHTAPHPAMVCAIGRKMPSINLLAFSAVFPEKVNCSLIIAWFSCRREAAARGFNLSIIELKKDDVRLVGPLGTDGALMSPGLPLFFNMVSLGEGIRLVFPIPRCSSWFSTARD